MYDSKTQAWLDKHESELPSMNSGIRIHGDPIAYMGKQPPEYLKPMQVSEKDDEPSSGPRAVGPTATQLIESHLNKRGFTNKRLIVFWARCKGATQQEIAFAMGVSQQAIADIEASINQLLTKTSLVKCRMRGGGL